MLEPMGAPSAVTFLLVTNGVQLCILTWRRIWRVSPRFCSP